MILNFPAGVGQGWASMAHHVWKERDEQCGTWCINPHQAMSSMRTYFASYPSHRNRRSWGPFGGFHTCCSAVEVGLSNSRSKCICQ